VGPGRIVALATDLAEVVGGAIALNLLFHLPLLLAVVLIGFVVSTAKSDPSATGVIGGLVPRLDGTQSLVLAAGMLGATVMPHAIWLHGALVTDRHWKTIHTDDGKTRVLRATRLDVAIAMALAGAVNLAMVVLAAAALKGTGADSLDAAHTAIGDRIGQLPALLFALALLASGFASSSVGTYAGSVILDGFWQRRVPLAARRLITLVPALLVLAIGIDPSRALVVSQVVLSFGIPCALWPLVRALNVVLIVLTLRG
jgi:manganese transport protein